MKDIFEAATRFRDAIEKCHKTLGNGFDDFPSYACGVTSTFLGTYLKEKGLGIFDSYVADVPGGNHAWLQKGDLIVDITADQFDHIKDPVIVSINSPWHLSLNAENQGNADFREASLSQSEDEDVYRKICAVIEQRT
ncbi:TPA: hypothetical protein KDX49_004807 [Vibrio parahaemolyticus]|nr:hypothetical protein [Vibrio parahaemolyticus]HBH7862289.1 hypothetical protein [Vibrio parahaemolyticus]HBH7904724.1 hypothetical protein [Vibrio parahaemolyticus]